MRTTALLLLTLMLTACAETDTLKVGGLFALTGGGAQFGQDELRGATLAIEEINAAGGIEGMQLELVTEDTQTDFAGTLTAYRKLADADGVSYIIGPTWGPFAEPLIPLLDTDGIVMICPTAGEENEAYKHPSFFKTWGADRLEIPVLIAHMEENGIRRIATITTAGSFEESMKQNFLREITSSGVEVVLELQTDADEKDFRSLLQQAQVADVDGIYIVFGGGFDQAGLFFRQMYEQDITLPVYAWSGFENYRLLENYAPYLENAYYPIPIMTERDAAFNERFKERFGSEPLTPAAATSYDAAKMLALALEQGNDPGSVRQALLEIRNYSGASPITHFNEWGWAQTTREYKVRTVREGKFMDAQ